jgi:ribosomal-protein-alanine N-acetyltransferase
MRIFEAGKAEEIVTVVCNKCKKAMKVEDNIVKEGLFEAAYQFGYFSKKDGEVHSFDLCEDCYDDIAGDFLIPPEVSEANEVL